jgi:hypothetical protein
MHMSGAHVCATRGVVLHEQGTTRFPESACSTGKASHARYAKPAADASGSCRAVANACVVSGSGAVPARVVRWSVVGSKHHWPDSNRRCAHMPHRYTSVHVVCGVRTCPNRAVLSDCYPRQFLLRAGATGAQHSGAESQQLQTLSNA